VTCARKTVGPDKLFPQGYKQLKPYFRITPQPERKLVGDNL
jgi:hypothetical protein